MRELLTEIVLALAIVVIVTPGLIWWGLTLAGVIFGVKP